MSENNASQADERAPWSCPWNICNNSEAQKCRHLMKTGCGKRFPADMSAEQAAESIKLPAALASTPAPLQVVPGSDKFQPDALERIIDEYVADYEMYGENAEGLSGTYTPNETERGLIKDAIIGLLAYPDWDDEWGAHIRSLAAQRAIAAPQVAQPAVRVPLTPYDAGLLSDHGGGNVEWWQDYLRAELARAHDFYQSQAPAMAELRLTDAQLNAAISVYHGLKVGETTWNSPTRDAMRNAINAAHGITPLSSEKGDGQ